MAVSFPPVLQNSALAHIAYIMAEKRSIYVSSNCFQCNLHEINMTEMSSAHKYTM